MLRALHFPKATSGPSWAQFRTHPTNEQKSLLHQLGLDLPERFQLNRKCSVDPAVA
jgi:hypothetical protein